jgi:hypothetical protein
MMLRHSLAILAALLLHGGPAAAQSQTVQSPERTTGAGEIDFGVRVASDLGGIGRYQSFSDPRTGPTLDRFRYTRTRKNWIFEAAVDHAGYRDQRYAAL